MSIVIANAMDLSAVDGSAWKGKSQYRDMVGSVWKGRIGIAKHIFNVASCSHALTLSTGKLLKMLGPRVLIDD
jgi:hypothetical protein